VVIVLGDVYLQLGDADSALAGYRNALAIRESLLAANLDDVEGRTQLARLYEKLGDITHCKRRSGFHLRLVRETGLKRDAGISKASTCGKTCSNKKRWQRITRKNLSKSHSN
jgi:tetratricopeptide (TPR) repeat protein